MADNKDINKLIACFGKKPSFTIDELRSYFRKDDPSLNESTLRWRIHNLKNDNVIISVGRGVYSFQNKPSWIPAIDTSIRSVYKKIEKQYNDLIFSVWSTSWLNEFTNLQAFRYLVIIEVEADFAESIFDYLKETGLKNLYFQPGKKEVSNYLSDVRETYVIESLVTKSPVQLIEKINVPRLEKILVDLFCDKDLLYAYQGSELSNIFQKAFSTYALNISALVNYSRRRARDKELIDFIKNKAGIKLPLL